ncbi:MAG: TIGR01212 family radical SAM protein [Clostridium sp.]|nr:TIGR01212 family radical SAM protein [Clostridium sp.]
MNQWKGKPYHSLDYELRKQFGQKIYKLSLDGGMTCPNRDGAIGRRGCIFCSEGGSGDFAVPASAGASVFSRIEEAKLQVQKKAPSAGGLRYIAYFQSYTNTYGPLEYLEALFTEALSHPDIAAVSIATRPDCLDGQVVNLLARLNRIKPVWVELGLQTIHEETAAFIRRGYPLPVFEKALDRLNASGLTAVVHVILGLPGETPSMMYSTVRYLAHKNIQGLKLQLLHVLKGTDLAALYESSPFPVFTMEEYIDTVIRCVELLPPEVVIHRLTGDGPKSLLLAPAWSGSKRLVLNALHKRFRESGSWQGKEYTDT